jgi:alpha-2-macroglobulin-like protein
MVSTDKPVYQPGQTIHVRSLALQRPDLRAAGRQSVEFTVTDPKGNVIFKQTRLDQPLRHHVDRLPVGSRNHRGRVPDPVRGRFDDQRRHGQGREVRAAEIQGGRDVGQSFYAPGDTVRGTLQADYFFGKPVADGAVKIEVRAMEIGPSVLARSMREPTPTDAPSSRSGCRRGWSGASRKRPSPIPAGRHRHRPAGQQHSVGASRVVTAEPIQVTVIPEGGTLVQGVPTRSTSSPTTPTAARPRRASWRTA